MNADGAGVEEPRIAINAKTLRPLYWSLLGLGGCLVLIGIGGSWGVQITGCFAAIAARIVQAEYHRLTDNRRSDNG